MLESFVLRPPELELPGEEEVLSTAELVGDLLTGGTRPDVLPQRGSSVASVTTLLDGEKASTEDGRASGTTEDELPAARLLLGPLPGGAARFHAPLPVAQASRGRESPEGAPEGRIESAQGSGPAESPSYPLVLAAAGVLGAVGVALEARRREQARQLREAEQALGPRPAS
jgi:hypothetical protein